VQVETAQRSDGQNVFTDQIAIIKRKQYIGRILADAFGPNGVIHVFRRKSRYTQPGRLMGHGGKKSGLARIIRMGEHGLDVIPGVHQGLKADTPQIVIGEYNSFHAIVFPHFFWPSSSGMAAPITCCTK
jgi:hypothetical protein